MIGAGDIKDALRSLGVGAQDTLFVHAGMAGALRAEGSTRAEKLATVVAGLRGAVAEGTLILPTFSYSATRQEPFDVDATPSTVGMLTEHFRLRPGVRRTPEPVFSVAVEGEVRRDWADALFGVGDVDCFGERSVFAYLEEVDAQLLFFGVGFEFCTFVHRVEQRAGVAYRYPKDFPAEVVVHGTAHHVTARYLVRDLDADVESEFGPLAAELERRGALVRDRMPRGPRIELVRARAVAEIATEVLRSAPDFLLTRGHRPQRAMAG